MTIDEIISSVIAYGLKTKILNEEDKSYAVNRLLFLFRQDTYKEEKVYPIEETMKAAVNYAKEHFLVELDNMNEEDCFDAEVMDKLLPRPSQVSEEFRRLMKISPKEATDWFYRLSIDDRYVRTDRLANNIQYVAQGETCALDITINLSKPEKDPKEIARLKTIKSSSYPLCALCRENEGFYGSYSWPGRANHRIIPLKLNGEDFFLQYSPYGYFPEHCIVLAKEHQPMTIDDKTFARLFDFLDMFPHYMVGSNADLPIVGGSILTHEHYQGGNYLFQLQKAQLRKEIFFKGYPNIKAGIVNWPMSVIRLEGPDRRDIESLCSKILHYWRKYSDPSLSIIGFDQEEHNTLNPIVRKDGKNYIIDIALRNNCTNAMYPLGIFHAHEEYWHIKKENIGLIEVMGLAILPGRLKDELKLCEEYLLNEPKDLDPSLEKHLKWLKEIRSRHSVISKDNVKQIVRQEVALVFEKVLECCGVFKADNEGQEGFDRFIKFVNEA